MTARPLTLHVGLPKAGSTTLQQNLFHRLPGTAYHAIRRKAGPHDEASPFGGVVRNLREGHCLDLDIPAFRAWFRSARDAMPADRDLVSEERFCDHLGPGLRQRADLLRALFGPATVLMVIRRPEALMSSTFFQERRFVRYGLSRGANLDAWLGAALDHADHFLSPLQMVRYDVMAEMFGAAFGHENVVVAPLEWLSADPPRFAERLSTALGRPGPEIEALLTVRGRAENTRNAGALIGNVRRNGVRQVVRELLAASQSRHIRPETARRLAAFAAPGIARIAERQNLPLAELGYPV